MPIKPRRRPRPRRAALQREWRVPRDGSCRPRWYRQATRLGQKRYGPGGLKRPSRVTTAAGHVKRAASSGAGPGSGMPTSNGAHHVCGSRKARPQIPIHDTGESSAHEPCKSDLDPNLGSMTPIAQFAPTPTGLVIADGCAQPHAAAQPVAWLLQLAPRSTASAPPGDPRRRLLVTGRLDRTRPDRARPCTEGSDPVRQETRGGGW